MDISSILSFAYFFNIIIFIFLVSCYSTCSYTLLVLTIDRFLAIMFPLKTRPTASNCLATVLIFIIWLFCCCVAIPLPLVSKLRQRKWQDYSETICVEHWPPCGIINSNLVKETYWTCTTVVIFSIPMLAMIIMHIIIVHKLRKNNRKVRNSCETPSVIMVREEASSTLSAKAKFRVCIAMYILFHL